jgi:hypothetical protein
MAKIRKYKLSWEASDSSTVIGYKLYWSKGAEVSYDSKFIKVGNVTEITLPDDVILSDGPVMFGVTAIDKDGNESDMALIAEPYQLHVPKAPVCVAQSRRHDEDLAQALLAVRSPIPGRTGRRPRSRGRRFHPAGPPRRRRGRWHRWDTIPAGAASGAGIGVDHGQVVGGVDHRQAAVPPEPQGVAAILAAVADAGFRAGFPGPGVKGLVDQPGLLRFLKDLQGFLPGDFLGKSLGAGVPRGFAERKAVQHGRIRAARSPSRLRRWRQKQWPTAMSSNLLMIASTVWLGRMNSSVASTGFSTGMIRIAFPSTVLVGRHGPVDSRGRREQRRQCVVIALGLVPELCQQPLEEPGERLFPPRCRSARP